MVAPIYKHLFILPHRSFIVGPLSQIQSQIPESNPVPPQSFKIKHIVYNSYLFILETEMAPRQKTVLESPKDTGDGNCISSLRRFRQG